METIVARSVFAELTVAGSFVAEYIVLEFIFAESMGRIQLLRSHCCRVQCEVSIVAGSIGRCTLLLNKILRDTLLLSTLLRGLFLRGPFLWRLLLWNPMLLVHCPLPVCCGVDCCEVH